MRTHARACAPRVARPCSPNFGYPLMACTPLSPPVHPGTERKQRWKGGDREGWRRKAPLPGVLRPGVVLMAQGAGHKGTGMRRGCEARKVSWVTCLTSGRAQASNSDHGWRLSVTSHLEDFRTDPRAGTNPRPAWLPGAERRCSASVIWGS